MKSIAVAVSVQIRVCMHDEGANQANRHLILFSMLAHQDREVCADSIRSSHVSSEIQLSPELESSTDDASMMIPDQFNDTIERMEYMMEHGRRLVDAKHGAIKKTPAPSSSLPRTPLHSPNVGRLNANRSPCHTPSTEVTSQKVHSTSKQKLFGTPVAPDSPILKAKSTNSPATHSNNKFKLPMPISLPKKTTTPLTGSGIPRPVSAKKKPLYDYVKSPIGAYINQRPPNPTRQNILPVRDFLDSTYCAGATKGLDFTLPTAHEDQPKLRYARKIYIQASDEKVPSEYTIYKHPAMLTHMFRLYFRLSTDARTSCPATRTCRS